MLEKLNNVVFSNDDIDLDDIDSDIVNFFSESMGLVTIDLHDIKLNGDIWSKYDPAITALVRLTAWRNRFKQRKARRKK